MFLEEGNWYRLSQYAFLFNCAISWNKNAKGQSIKPTMMLLREGMPIQSGVDSSMELSPFRDWLVNEERQSFASNIQKLSRLGLLVNFNIT